MVEALTPNPEPETETLCRTRLPGFVSRLARLATPKACYTATGAARCCLHLRRPCSRYAAALQSFRGSSAVAVSAAALQLGFCGGPTACICNGWQPAAAAAKGAALTPGGSRTGCPPSVRTLRFGPCAPLPPCASPRRSNVLHSLMVCMPDTVGLGSSDTVCMIVPLFHANSWGARARQAPTPSID